MTNIKLFVIDYLYLSVPFWLVTQVVLARVNIFHLSIFWHQQLHLYFVF